VNFDPGAFQLRGIAVRSLRSSDEGGGAPDRENCMTRGCINIRCFRPAELLAMILLASTATAARLEKTFYAASTTLYVKVSDAALRKLLPEGWEPLAVPAMQGGNLTVTFTDILAAESVDGRPADTARAVWLAAPVHKRGTSERAGAVLGGLASHPSFVPGPYGNYRLAEAKLDRSRRVDASGATISEQWQFAGDDGARVDLRLTFTPGPAQHLKPPPSKVISATKPALRRVNKTEVVAQELRIGDANAVKDVHLAATGPLWGALFDGSQQLVAVVSVPWLVTQVLVP
jgi:hypothetical protein